MVLIENRDLLHKFEEKKDKLKQKNVADPEVVLAFHGTAAAYVLSRISIMPVV